MNLYVAPEAVRQEEIYGQQVSIAVVTHHLCDSSLPSAADHPLDVGTVDVDFANRKGNETVLWQTQTRQ